jgi:hypothetical protein
MKALLVELAAILLSCLKQIPKLGMGGMLRVSKPAKHSPLNG